MNFFEKFFAYFPRTPVFAVLIPVLTIFVLVLTTYIPVLIVCMSELPPI